MPRATGESGPELAIVLDHQTAFKGGDTISGHVFRKTHIVDPNASLQISLYGKTHAKIHFSKGTTQIEYRSNFSLFGGSSEGHQLHQGPIHIPPNGPEPGRWPFVIHLPRHPDLASLRKNNENERSYLPLNDASAHDLPPTFYSKATAFGRWVEAYVEYHLEATLVGSGKKQHRAIYPLRVLQISPPKPITDFDAKRNSGIRQRIVSQRLVPGMGNARLSLGQKTKKIFGSSQIPGYSFTLQLEFASLLQIGNPNTIPLFVGATPNWKDTSEVLQNVPQMITIKHFTLTLHPKTSYASKRLHKGELSDTKSITLADYEGKSRPNKLVSSSANAKETQEEMPPNMDTLIVPNDSSVPPIDLGTALGIRIASEYGGTNVYSTFTTYNLKNEHHLEWELVLTVAGETVKYSGKQPVTVIGPSHD